MWISSWTESREGTGLDACPFCASWPSPEAPAPILKSFPSILTEADGGAINGLAAGEITAMIVGLGRSASQAASSGMNRVI